jgi:hypothetical protein
MTVFLTDCSPHRRLPFHLSFALERRGAAAALAQFDGHLHLLARLHEVVVLDVASLPQDDDAVAVVLAEPQ